MKRSVFCVLACLVALGGSAAAQVSAFPYNYGWTGVSNLSGDGNWSQSIVSGVNAWVFSSTGGYTDSTCVTFNPGNDKTASARMVLRLNTAGQAFTSGEVLRFCLRRSANQVDAKIFVEWSLDDISYSPIDSIAYSVASAQGSFAANQIALPSTLGNRNLVYLAIRLTGNKATQQGFSAGFLDDVAVQGGALPVQLTNFSVTAARLDVRLRWSTAAEINNHGFDIERRGIGSPTQASTSWQKIGSVRGNGTTSSSRDYSFTDRGVVPGRYGYRIKQIDNDGSFTFYSATEVVVGAAPKELMLGSNYPNPFNPSTTIDFTLAHPGKATLQVFNMLGEEVARLFDEQAEAGRIYQVKFDGSQMPSGVYFYTLSHGNHRLLKKFVLMK